MNRLGGVWQKFGGLGLAPVLVALLSAGAASASDDVRGVAVDFLSPGGVTEQCVRIDRILGGVYPTSDAEDEAALCRIELYAPGVGLCPQIWQPGVGMAVYDLGSGPYAGDRVSFERKACKEGPQAVDLSTGPIARFQPTMNNDNTVGTYAPAALLYYQASRYFGMQVQVPVAVWRSMARSEHLTLVANAGLSLAPQGWHRDWQVLTEAEAEPRSYTPVYDLFTTDLDKIYGAMTRDAGHRYGTAMNGIRKSDGAEAQHQEFQDTPAFLALRSEKPLAEAIADGLEQGRLEPQIDRDLGADVPPAQMVFWMRELSEIALLDFLFSQQDRVGNIDFLAYHYRVVDGEIQRDPVPLHEADDPAGDALLIRRTVLNDNAAAGRAGYDNWARTTGMLEKLRHFDSGVYARLITLNTDFQAEGPLRTYFATSFGLTELDLAQLAENVALASDILRTSCMKGQLQFDLDPEGFLRNGRVLPADQSCDGL